MRNGLPRHVAIIMDGNGRWAKRRQLPRIAGHRAGVENVRTVVRRCAELGIEVLTLFAFSSENWRRPPTEVRLLMDLFVMALDQEAAKLHENGIRLQVIGDRTAFPKRLQRTIASAEALTRDNRALTLVIAANYGGRWDIAQAARKLAEDVRAGTLEPADITPEALSPHLCLSGLPEPDLFIRSGGEERISNYLLWQLAYTELYFTDCLWPDFDAAQFEVALESYACRQRRFGMTGDQVEGREAPAAVPGV
ncbi:MAG: isoprenyl transferase [Gammaproteobacteria bacterium]|nr:isoprenyl transferase [Gammaproteobacteria bacterium]MBI5617298.1 isoprenyl transferase [Gammaproteobacteria bacterium]